MPALPPYIPPTDADLANWAANFNTLITASPGTYGLLTSDATAISAVTTPFLTAYSAAINPPTRTPVSVAVKDTQKINMLATLRPYAIQISLNAGVLTSDKIAVGVNPRTSTPLPIAAPTTSPIISIVSATNLQHVLRARDETSSPSVKAKPYGVTQMLCFAAASATPITDPDLLPYKLTCTKFPVVLPWDYENAGKVAYYAARWATRTGLLGPWSPIVNFTVAAG